MSAAGKSVLVFGAGAVGCLVGGLLAKAGHHVTFIARRRIVEALRASGLTISGVWGEHRVSGPLETFESLSDIPNAPCLWDWVLITTKCFDTASAAGEIRNLLPGIGFCISLQNGLGNLETIAQEIGWEKTLGGRVITGVEIPHPGEVRVTVHADEIRLGHLRREVSMSVIEEIAAQWRSAGIPVAATEELEQYIWAKVLYNVALNPLGALLGATYGDLADHESTREVMNELIEEAFAVAMAHRVSLFWSDPAAYEEVFYGQMVPPTRGHYPSMLRDLEFGRRTEIDALNGRIVCLAEEKGIEVPANRLVVRLIRYREKEGLGRQKVVSS
jgi:2-dehydropantoate 2-reductase